MTTLAAPGVDHWRRPSVVKSGPIAPAAAGPGADRLTRLDRQDTMRRMEPGQPRNVLSQLRRGTVEYCVLALLRDGERYGFDLVRTLAQVDGLVTSEGTIYPLLGRLRREDLVSTSWRESDAGPPRRYYRLTEAGHAALAGFTEEWVRFRDAVDALLVGEKGDGHRAP
jgi:PadR family transcriptional regulator, regulatory protein PadR